MIPTFALEPVIDRLPVGFDDMRAEARAEGYLFLERLFADWNARTMRFDREGEVLVAARVGDVLARRSEALTLDPVVTGALRVRRFYVYPSFRR